MTERFTIVFEGDIRKFAGNPLKTETPFGIPYTVAVGDIVEQFNELQDSSTHAPAAPAPASDAFVEKLLAKWEANPGLMVFGTSKTVDAIASAFRAELSKPRLTKEMRRLIVASRIVAFEDQGADAIKELDEASYADLRASGGIFPEAYAAAPPARSAAIAAEPVALVAAQQIARDVCRKAKGISDGLPVGDPEKLRWLHHSYGADEVAYLLDGHIDAAPVSSPEIPDNSPEPDLKEALRTISFILQAFEQVEKEAPWFRQAFAKGKEVLAKHGLYSGAIASPEPDAVRVGDVRWGVNVLLETIAKQFEAWDTMDLWRSQAADLVRSHKHITKPEIEAATAAASRNDRNTGGPQS